jgi:hypothetical protein
MSKETILKKEFVEKDIQRIRNLVRGNYNDSTQTQVGYTRKSIDRKENEIWEEDGKHWIIKNGVKISESKLGNAKKYTFIPILCPKCNKPMKKEHDKKMFHLHSTCLDCVIKMETKLKLEGKFDEYENNIIKNNIKSVLNSFENELDDFVDSFYGNEQFVSENGDIEDWHAKAVDKEKIRKQLLEDIEEARYKLTN